MGEKGMSSLQEGIEIQEQFSRLARTAAVPERGEAARVTATGAAPPAWVIKIESLAAYNVYNVQPVSLGLPGSPPAPITSGMTAVNIAEPFTSGGSVPAGTYAILWRVGDQNIFYVKP
jgi:hypothetical protein